jgi:hypothetical protein
MNSSASDFGRDHGLVHEAVVTGRKAGWTQGDWAELAHDVDFMRQIRAVRLGLATINPIERVVDLDTDPVVPQGLKVVGHLRGGKWKFNREELLKVFLSEKWWGLERFTGDTSEETATPRKGAFNASLLDFLLAHQYLIPGELKENTVYFWDTLYGHRSGGGVGVRCLYWRRGRWHSSVCFISTTITDELAAALKKQI